MCVKNMFCEIVCKKKRLAAPCGPKRRNIQAQVIMQQGSLSKHSIPVFQEKYGYS